MPSLSAEHPMMHTSSERRRVADDVTEASRLIAQHAGSGVRS